MEKDKKKIEEPYTPENTPNPPQRVDPESEEKRDKPESGDRRSPGSERKKDESEEKAHPLNEETEVDDETTI